MFFMMTSLTPAVVGLPISVVQKISVSLSLTQTASSSSLMKHESLKQKSTCSSRVHSNPIGKPLDKDTQ
jgi:hypothetical protein